MAAGRKNRVLSTYSVEEAEGDQPHDPEDKVARERVERIHKRCNKDDGKCRTDARSNEGVDDPAISRPVAVGHAAQERPENADHNDGADELPDAQAHQHDF